MVCSAEKTKLSSFLYSTLYNPPYMSTTYSTFNSLGLLCCLLELEEMQAEVGILQKVVASSSLRSLKGCRERRQWGVDRDWVVTHKQAEGRMRVCARGAGILCEWKPSKEGTPRGCMQRIETRIKMKTRWRLQCVWWVGNTGTALVLYTGHSLIITYRRARYVVRNSFIRN